MKAGSRGIQLRQMRKDQNRAREMVGRIRKENAELRAQLEEQVVRTRNEIVLQETPLASSAGLIQMSLYAQVRSLCVMMVMAGSISFRSIPRVLKILLQGDWITSVPVPHFTSVINWTLRCGIGIYKQVSVLNEPWFALVDCSIDIGIRKALVVLRVPLSTVQRKQGAVGLGDCECIGIKVATSWNGVSVANELVNVFAKTGEPIVIIKDQGSDLSRGVRLYGEKEHTRPIPVVDDVGHVAANALKAEFAKNTEFKRFLKVVNNTAAKIRQTTLAFLLPPKVRSKGRFQGITKLAKWVQKILYIVDTTQLPNEKEPFDQQLFLKAFSKLVGVRKFLQRFVETGSCVESFLQLLKNKGLNQESYLEAKTILEKMPHDSKVRTRLEAWLTKHLDIHSLLKLGDQKLLVSDDVLESLFGYFKTVIQRCPKAELNRLVYVIPLLCGKHSSEDIGQAIRRCTHKEMCTFLEQELPPTLRQQRFKLFKPISSQVPKTGKIPSPAAAKISTA